MAKPRALITGGSRGIGLGVAKRLAQDGWDLGICGVRSEAEATPALDELRGLGAAVDYVAADVGDKSARERLIETLRGHWSRLDLLVNNAGVAPAVRADLLEAGEDSFERLMRINCAGPYFLTQLCARWMIESRRADPSFRPQIIFVTSVSATVASINRGDYCMSKAALAMAAQLWAARLGGEGINVFEVRPGVISTDMTSGVQGKYDDLIAKGLTVQPRWGTPEDIGRAVAALARGDFPYSSGGVFTIDGGLTVPRL
jgi:NAD(P)-dependent dehydrogenase (short-subunit alcohol dehydrogenase family)